MKNPIKIIHKIKNTNKRIQYLLYIFIGHNIMISNNHIMKILENIKDLDFYETLRHLSKDDFKTLEEIYSENWYEKLFISHHLIAQRKKINNNAIYKKQIETKYGSNWYKKHIMKSNISKIKYSFASEYINNLPEFKKPKIKSIDIDYRSDKMIGGADNQDNDNDDNDEIDVEEVIEDDFNIDEIANLYKTQEVETKKEITHTYEEINKIISEDKNKKKYKTENKYDADIDNISYDISLENVYKKIYITSQYIYTDDTITKMRQKITMAINISEIFGENIKLLPETQYFWSEYTYDNNVDHVMLGQKWLKRNELLKIDIIPNDNLKIYENLRNNLAYLKESFNYKIKRENDEENIIRYYEDYITMNEIYMIDIYNELGINYSPSAEEMANLYDVYINIYFPMISFVRYENIIKLLNNQTQNNSLNELNYIEVQYNTIKNDNLIESKIEDIVEETSVKFNKNINKYFSENYVLLSNIHINLLDPNNKSGTISNSKLNLYNIFENFNVNDDYPFIQYQSPDSDITVKINTKTKKTEDPEILNKWLEYTPYGISFKIKLNESSFVDKYLSINLNDNFKLNYKITWKEEDSASVDDIKFTFNYIRDLITKINSENSKVKIILPSDDKYKYAFINTIQHFRLPEKFKIDHNDLSDFSRYFFPFISMVIEPKKRESKKSESTNTNSKYGTYLRYKRISKYDNKLKIQLRILFFLRNYIMTDKEVIDEVSKQFNLTADSVVKELQHVKEKYSKIINVNKKKTKPDNLSRTKPPGVEISIQGRSSDNYKIRITGARNKEQLDEIVTFMKILIYLYVESYLFKNPLYQDIKNQLKKLTNIAIRRNKVPIVVDYEGTIDNIKQITALDKARLGFKPEKGQSQWSRSCQNSGTKNKRRPDIISYDKIDKLLKDGYKLNTKTNFYEKEITVKNKKSKSGETTIIRAIKLDDGHNNFLVYSCDPNVNKEHIHIGFLSRGNNPSDLCMPCCFKKDQVTATNKKKKNYFLKCVGQKVTDEKKDVTLGDKIYILEETNKVQDDRYIYLSKYLDIFFNRIVNNDSKIQNHYFLESKSGYFFKYTIKNDDYYFLAALANIYSLQISEIIKNIITFLEKDKNNIYFTYLNNGDLIESFKTKEKFIEYLTNSVYLEYDVVGELCAIPGVISKNGINYYIINKSVKVIKKALEKDKIVDKYYIDSLNIENNYQYNDDSRDIIILTKEDNYYFPIYRLLKNNKIHKKIQVQRIFRVEDELIKENINLLKNYHYNSCSNALIFNITSYYLIAKNIIYELEKNNIKITKQYIDLRNKCKYIELDNSLIMPVISSGISYNYPFVKLEKNILNNKLLSYKKVISLLNLIENKIKLDYVPKIIYYDDKNKDKIRIVSIMLNNNLIIPVFNENISVNDIKKLGLPMYYQSTNIIIDNYILENKETKISDHAINVNHHKYMNESYNLYRLELSFFLDKHKNIKEKIIDIVNNKNISLSEKKNELKNILFQLIDKKLAKQYKVYTVDINNKTPLLQSAKSLPGLNDYIVKNVRDYCSVHKTSNKCENNKHCIWKSNSCRFMLLDSIIPDFISRIIEEFIAQDIKYKELIQEEPYYVSDVVDVTQFTIKPDQKIIKSNNINLQKILSELYGKDKIPNIGKKFFKKETNTDINNEYNLIELNDTYQQEIINNNDSIIRGYINSYYWISNPLYDIESRNLGYYNDLQTTLTYIFKANIIDYIITNISMPEFKDFTSDNFFQSKLNKFKKNIFNTNGYIELLVLSHLIPIPIVVYDNFNNIKYIFSQGEIEINKKTISLYTNKEKVIILRLDFDNDLVVPKKVYSIYKKINI
jgi:hypothetical protein